MSDPVLGGRRVLVVEDLPAIRELLRMALQDAGAEVVTAAEGKAALAALQGMASPPDLILLDLAMPGMSGWQFLEAIAAREDLARVPVILETSSEDLTSVYRARRREVAAFISKPFRLGEVIETCRRVLEGARPFQGRAAPESGCPAVEMKDALGVRLASGSLLGRDERGAQVELDRMLSPGERVWLHVVKDSKAPTGPFEVRWVTRAGSEFHHGLTLRDE